MMSEGMPACEGGEGGETCQNQSCGWWRGPHLTARDHREPAACHPLSPPRGSAVGREHLLLIGSHTTYLILILGDPKVSINDR